MSLSTCRGLHDLSYRVSFVSSLPIKRCYQVAYHLCYSVVSMFHCDLMYFPTSYFPSALLWLWLFCFSFLHPLLSSSRLLLRIVEDWFQGCD